MELNKFLVCAKRKTYARNGKETILPDGARELTYIENSYKYRDRYYGFNPFLGQELVWDNNELIWGMNYYGKIYADHLKNHLDLELNEKNIYEFLKESLIFMSENYPFRGPLKFEKGLFTYINNYEGGLNYFSGKEIINFFGTNVYSLKYHGGKLKQNARN